MSGYPSEDVIQEGDCLIDVRSLVQHHALSSLLRRGAHGVKQDVGESSEGGGALDFQDESEVLSSERFEVPVYDVDIVFVA